MKNLKFTPFRTSRTSHELTHAKKTLVALATLSALGHGLRLGLSLE